MAITRLCSIPDCSKPVHSAGHCSGHHKRLVRYGNPLHVPVKVNEGACSVEGCRAPARTMGWCRTHYWRWRHHGDPLGGRAARGDKGRWLEAHAGFRGDDCLIFPFGNARYGHVTMDGAKMHAHRAMCLIAHGEPPSDTHEVAHSCGRGEDACVHPQHLRWDTPKGNQADRLIHDTHCRGERSGTAKLTEDQVREIRSLQGVVSKVALAKRFGVSKTAISHIYRKITWVWLD